MKIKELLYNLRRKYYKWKVKRNLSKHNKEMLETETILEAWLTNILLNVELSDKEKEAERNELLKKQFSIRRIELFIEWLKHQ